MNPAWQRPRAGTFWRHRSGNQVMVERVRRGIVYAMNVPLPCKRWTMPVSEWNLRRVWIGGERDFPRLY